MKKQECIVQTTLTLLPFAVCVIATAAEQLWMIGISVLLAVSEIIFMPFCKKRENLFSFLYTALIFTPAFVLVLK